jgi:hypothetical protein
LVYITGCKERSLFYILFGLQVADVGSFLRSAIGLAIFEDSKDVLPQGV